MSRIGRAGALAAYALLLWLAALWLAWIVLARADFLYPVAYRLLDIPSTLEAYVPHNRHGRQDFLSTDAAEHARLFSAIVHAVRHGGEGLEEIGYHDPQGHRLGRLLTEDEITHLRDVAHLVSTWERVGLFAFAAWLGLGLISILRRLPLPGMGRLLKGCVGLLLLAAGLVVLAGPVEVFYAWHRWVFPPGHPWFFYYQDSLMSSLMQAPNLFGFIGVLWLFTALLVLLALHIFMRMVARGLLGRGR